jgi:TonB family protein
VVAKKGIAKPRPKAQSSGREGPGARAKGAEGTRGSPTAPAHKTPQNVARRPSPERGKGAGGARSQVAEDGSLDALRGASEKIKDLLGGATARLGKSGEKLKGFGAFESEGSGGLALSQKGRGGGGKSPGLGGTADFGTAGGRVGVGAGSSGTGSGILSGRGRVDLRQGGPEETVVMGSIDASAIEAAILAHKDEFRLCYEKELNAGRPSLSGRVLPLFVIGSSGRVSRAAVKESSLHSANVERCVLQVIKRIQFPAPAGGGTVEVTYPFKFRALGG